MKSRSRSASARPDQLSLSSWASWCCMLCTLQGPKNNHPGSSYGPRSAQTDPVPQPPAGQGQLTGNQLLTSTTDMLHV